MMNYNSNNFLLFKSMVTKNTTINKRKESIMKTIEIINKQTMSSREIAQITKKPHNDVLKSIRAMEPAWEKVNEGKFSLVEYTDAKGEKRPEYQLSKLECLYIAAKFNDETRAILVKRWYELETEAKPEQGKQIDTQATYREGEVYITRLGENTLLGYYGNGQHYFQMNGVMRFFDFNSGGRTYAQKFGLKNSMLVEHGKIASWFVNINWIDEFLKRTTYKIPYEKVSRLYRDLFGVEKGSIDGSQFTYKFTDRQMLEVLSLINRFGKPGLQAEIVDKLMNAAI